MLILLLLSYLMAVGLKGNGFVAAFVAGLLFRPAALLLPKDALPPGRGHERASGPAGAGSCSAISSTRPWTMTNWAIVLFAALAVLVARSLRWSLAGPYQHRSADRWFLGWVKPLGLASIVFGLLAYIECPRRRTTSSPRSSSSPCWSASWCTERAWSPGDLVRPPAGHQGRSSPRRTARCRRRARPVGQISRKPARRRRPSAGPRGGASRPARAASRHRSRPAALRRPARSRRPDRRGPQALLEDRPLPHDRAGPHLGDRPSVHLDNGDPVEDEVQLVTGSPCRVSRNRPGAAASPASRHRA